MCLILAYIIDVYFMPAQAAMLAHIVKITMIQQSVEKLSSFTEYV